MVELPTWALIFLIIFAVIGAITVLGFLTALAGTIYEQIKWERWVKKHRGKKKEKKDDK